MEDWLKRRAVVITTTLGSLTVGLVAVTVFQAVLLHTQGWRTVSRSLPEWFGAAGSTATFAAFLIALAAYFNNPAGYTGIRLGFINASQGLAHAQIRLTGHLAGQHTPETHDELKDKLVRQLFVPFVEPGQWEALVALEDMRLSLTTVEVAFRDQALRWWVRDIDNGTLKPAEQGLFPVTNTPSREGNQSTDRLDLQARRRPYAAGRGNAGVVYNEVVRRLWAIEPVNHWPQDGLPKEPSPVTPEQAMQIAHIRALLVIGDAIRELNNYDA